LNWHATLVIYKLFLTGVYFVYCKMTGTASWDKLPLIVTSEVFGYLGNKDRFNASLVCKDWSDALYTPHIWRSTGLELEITGEDDVKDEKTVKMAEKIGAWVRDVKISCRYVVLTEKNMDSLSRIFDSMHRARLTKFEMKDLKVR